MYLICAINISFLLNRNDFGEEYDAEFAEEEDTSSLIQLISNTKIVQLLTSQTEEHTRKLHELQGHLEQQVSGNRTGVQFLGFLISIIKSTYYK